MGRNHNSKHSRRKRHRHKKGHNRERKLERKIEYLREISATFDESDDMKQISQSILDIHSLLEKYRAGIRYLQENENDLIDRACYELDIAEKLDTLRSKADTVYLFTTDYMKKNISGMTQELAKVMDECEDYVEAKNKDHFVYYLPLVNKYLYEKEKGELIEAIRHIENVYLSNVRLMLKLYDEVQEIMQDLDKYYGIPECIC
jgi:phosphopantetheine adenylyltransferase